MEVHGEELSKLPTSKSSRTCSRPAADNVLWEVALGLSRANTLDYRVGGAVCAAISLDFGTGWRGLYIAVYVDVLCDPGCCISHQEGCYDYSGEL